MPVQLPVITCGFPYALPLSIQLHPTTIHGVLSYDNAGAKCTSCSCMAGVRSVASRLMIDYFVPI